MVLEVGEGVPYGGMYAAAAHGVDDVEVLVCVVVVVCCDVVLVFGGGLLSVVGAGGGRMKYDLISVCRAVVVVGWLVVVRLHLSRCFLLALSLFACSARFLRSVVEPVRNSLCVSCIWWILTLFWGGG